MRRAEVIKNELLAAEEEVHPILEDDIGYRRAPALSQDVHACVRVRDRRRRIVEDLQAANVVFVIVAQDHVFDGHAEAPVELILEPGCIRLTAASRIDDDEAFVRDDD